MSVNNNRAKKADELTRREVAKILDRHPDSVSRLLHEGLACAVLQWGGRGKEMRFSRKQLERWRRARACRDTGRWCKACNEVLYDTEAIAEHLLETKHGYGGCQECRVTWKVCQPCGDA